MRRLKLDQQSSAEHGEGDVPIVENIKSNYYAGDRHMSQPEPSGQDGFQYDG